MREGIWRRMQGHLRCGLVLWLLGLGGRVLLLLQAVHHNARPMLDQPRPEDVVDRRRISLLDHPRRMERTIGKPRGARVHRRHRIRAYRPSDLRLLRGAAREEAPHWTVVHLVTSSPHTSAPSLVRMDDVKRRAR